MIAFEVLGNPVTQGSGKAINDRAGKSLSDYGLVVDE